MNFRLPIPRNWQDFEDICYSLWKDIWLDPNTQKHGRMGQNQAGVDIFGRPAKDSQHCGVQCKDKDGRLGSILTAKELCKEATKATGFTPALNSFTLATTSPRDVNIQSYYRELNDDRIFPFDVYVWSWDDIETELSYRSNILNAYYPSLADNYAANIDTIAINKYSSKDHLNAYFSRSAIRNFLNNEFIYDFKMLIYEMYDNSYIHGSGTEFKIIMDGSTLELCDNGIKFDPIINLLDVESCIQNNAGSYVFNIFKKKYKDKIIIEYEYKERKNILRLILKNININKNDEYYEFSLDSINYCGRDDARAFAKRLPTDKKEIIVNVNVCALSTYMGFIEGALERIGPKQKLTVYVPRTGWFSAEYIKDSRLEIKTR